MDNFYLQNREPSESITQATSENNTNSASLEFDADPKQDILNVIAEQGGWESDVLEDDGIAYGVPAAEVPADSESSDGFGLGDRGDSDEQSESDRDRDADYAMSGPEDEDEEDELCESEPEPEVRQPIKTRQVSSLCSSNIIRFSLTFLRYLS